MCDPLISITYCPANTQSEATVTTHKRSIWDDLVELGRDIADKIDEALNPHKKERKPVRVPVPIPLRNPNHPQNNPDNNPYGY